MIAEIGSAQTQETLVTLDFECVLAHFDAVVDLIESKVEFLRDSLWRSCCLNRCHASRSSKVFLTDVD